MFRHIAATVLPLLVCALLSAPASAESIGALSGVGRVVVDVFVDADASISKTADLVATRTYFYNALEKALKAANIVVVGPRDQKVQYPADVAVVLLSVDMMSAPCDVIATSMMLESFRYLETEIAANQPMFIQCTRSAEHGGFSSGRAGAGLDEQFSNVAGRFIALYERYHSQDTARR
jgi:hypothetical protein